MNETETETGRRDGAGPSYGRGVLALFDLDNTLIDRRQALDGWAGRFARSRSLAPRAALLISERLRDRAYPADLCELGQTLGLGDSAGDLWREYVEGMASAAQCLPGAEDGLHTLRRAGWTLGVATNGAGDIQRAKLTSAGLTPLFHGVCVSGEAGARKPTRQFFEIAAAQCGADLSGYGWMIGDNPETDIEGGRAAGLHTMWVAAGRQWPADVRSPDVVVADVAEAAAVLSALPL
ncbi:HAD family hydrolase [Streptomyces sp. NPDC058667]|uniref:HAD family hydrolase n=1 Tax=Streptomyces sp. NPDC058667 TaxID=3346588 RepID=UPI00364C3D9C